MTDKATIDKRIEAVIKQIKMEAWNEGEISPPTIKALKSLLLEVVREVVGEDEEVERDYRGRPMSYELTNEPIKEIRNQLRKSQLEKVRGL